VVEQVPVVDSFTVTVHIPAKAKSIQLHCTVVYSELLIVKPKNNMPVVRNTAVESPVPYRLSSLSVDIRYGSGPGRPV
jgi:hypothetical protein